MKWFYDLRATAKLFVCFGFIGAALVVIGYVGASATADTNASVEAAYTRDLKGVELALRADAARLKIARSYRHGILLETQQGRETAIREVDEQERVLQQELTELRSTIIQPDNLARVDEAMRLGADYARLGREAVRASAVDKAHALAGLSEANPVGLRLGDDIEKIVAAKHQVARQEQDRSAQRYVHGRAVIVVATAFALCFAVAAAVFVGRAIGAPLQAAVETLERVADGDLTSRLQQNTHRRSRAPRACAEHISRFDRAHARERPGHLRRGVGGIVPARR
jgi:methyl-accepting chemotaxis protein